MDEIKMNTAELNEQELDNVTGGFGMLGTAWHPAFPVCSACQKEFSVQVAGFDRKRNVCKCPNCGNTVEFFG